MTAAHGGTDTVLRRLQQALGDRYAVEHLLGSGGMATVWLARDKKHTGRPVAIKVLRPEVASALGSERFLREIQIAARLNHPHIVPMFDSGDAHGLLYYVMPFVEGETLRERLGREPPLTAPEAVRIVVDVAAALSYAHEHGIVHRDVKPENIMLVGDHAVVSDFGIARALGPTEPRLTEGGRMVGTRGYISPEQVATSMEIDARSDVYSLGCVLHEMLTGAPPERLLDPESVREGRILNASPGIRRALDAQPHELERALVRALAPLPDDRFATAAELVAALERGVFDLPRHVRSIAVLPFEHPPGDPESAYLGDGIAEEITSALAKVRSLDVASRTSAFAFRTRRADVRAIGSELGVATVLEGSVRRSGDRLRVHVRLVDTADGYERWSERYERAMRDVFAIQDDIARSVVGALEVILSASERRALARVPTQDVTAYEYYLRGRQFFHQTRKKSLEFAREMFEHAIELDPQFALAYAGIADCSSLLHTYYPSSADELERADRASHRALELDPDLPEAHAARGFALFQLGRHEEAAAEFQTAIRRDPAQFEARYFHARQCFQRGEFAAAARWFEDAARVRDDYQARFFAAQSYEAMGRSDEARAAYRRALDAAQHHLALNPDDPRATTMCAVSLCRLGEAERGLACAKRALAIDPEDAGVRYNVACLYALHGERELALTTLEECVRLGFGNLEWFERDPDLASLRGDPRFVALLEHAKEAASGSSRGAVETGPQS